MSIFCLFCMCREITVRLKFVIKIVFLDIAHFCLFLRFKIVDEIYNKGNGL